MKCDICCPEDRDHSICWELQEEGPLLHHYLSRGSHALAAQHLTSHNSCRAPHTPGCHCAKSIFTFRAAGLGQTENSHPPNKEGMIGVSHLSFACIAAFLSCFGELMDDPALKSNGEKESPQGIHMGFQFPFQINSVEVHKTISLY